MVEISAPKRESGISILGDVPWGTHFCQFYQTKQDLIDILVPYFKAGLKNNEFCMWVTSESLTVEEAKSSLKKAVQNLDDYIAEGQLEILDYSQWYTKSGKFESDYVLRSWAKKEEQVLKMGFDGLRVTGNISLLGKGDWENFADYEARVDNTIGKYRIKAVCSYSLDKCSESEIIEVADNHQFALIKKEDKWIVLESSERKRLAEALQKSEELYRTMVEALQEGLIIVDTHENISYVNPAACLILGYNQKELVKMNLCGFITPEGRRKVLQGTSKRRKGISEQYELQMKCKDGSFRDILVSVSPLTDEKGNYVRGVGLMMDITSRKQVELQLKDQSRVLLHKNIALKEILGQIAEDKSDIISNISNRLKKLVLPKLGRLKHKVNDMHQKSIGLIEKNIRNIAGSFGLKINDLTAVLSPREIEVCDLIRDNLSNKTINQELDISVKTVETIRKTIRRKLKLRNKQVNLRSYLKSL